MESPESGAAVPEQASHAPVKVWDIAEWIRLQQSKGDRNFENSYSADSSLTLPIRERNGKSTSKPDETTSPETHIFCRDGARGYTVNHGPWLYSLVRSHPVHSNIRGEIKDECSYSFFIHQTVKAKKETSDQYSIALHHVSRPCKISFLLNHCLIF